MERANVSEWEAAWLEYEDAKMGAWSDRFSQGRTREPWEDLQREDGVSEGLEMEGWSGS